MIDDYRDFAVGVKLEVVRCPLLTLPDVDRFDGIGQA
jgi:hypothetical protein